MLSYLCPTFCPTYYATTRRVYRTIILCIQTSTYNYNTTCNSSINFTLVYGITTNTTIRTVIPEMEVKDCIKTLFQLPPIRLLYMPSYVMMSTTTQLCYYAPYRSSILLHCIRCTIKYRSAVTILPVCVPTNREL